MLDTFLRARCYLDLTDRKTGPDIHYLAQVPQQMCGGATFPIQLCPTPKPSSPYCWSSDSEWSMDQQYPPQRELVKTAESQASAQVCQISTLTRSPSASCPWGRETQIQYVAKKQKKYLYRGDSSLNSSGIKPPVVYHNSWTWIHCLYNAQYRVNPV